MLSLYKIRHIQVTISLYFWSSALLLTFTFHASSQAFLKPAVLAAIPGVLVDDTGALLLAWVLQILLHSPFEESLASLTAKHWIVEARTLVTANHAETGFHCHFNIALQDRVILTGLGLAGTWICPNRCDDVTNDYGVRLWRPISFKPWVALIALIMDGLLVMDRFLMVQQVHITSMGHISHRGVSDNSGARWDDSSLDGIPSGINMADHSLDTMSRTRWLPAGCNDNSVVSRSLWRARRLPRGLVTIHGSLMLLCRVCWMTVNERCCW